MENTNTVQKNHNARKICILSGKRGGFGSLIRTMRLINQDPGLELQLIVTDMHLSAQFGKTLVEVEKEFNVAGKVAMDQKNGNSEARSEAMGVCLRDMTKVIHDLKPDIFLCLGDRGETLVSVIAANNLRIPVAHIQGGDISGNLDEVFRHAITKMSHIHFPSTGDSAKRIEKMGEDMARIHVVGDTHLDLITNKMYTPNAIVRKQFNLGDDEKYVVVLQHSVNTEPEKSYDQMSRTLEAVDRIGHKAVVVYPCSDQGYDGIVKAIEEHQDNSKFQIHKNIEAPDFLGLMSGAETLVGNSSSGIVETPSFKLPTVNIGKRQTGRLRDFNVWDAEGNSVEEIIGAIHYVTTNKEFKDSLENCGNIYGNGSAAEKIIKVLKEVELGDELFEKRMTY